MQNCLPSEEILVAPQGQARSQAPAKNFACSWAGLFQIVLKRIAYGSQLKKRHIRTLATSCGTSPGEFEAWRKPPFCPGWADRFSLP